MNDLVMLLQLQFCSFLREFDLLTEVWKDMETLMQPTYKIYNFYQLFAMVVLFVLYKSHLMHVTDSFSSLNGSIYFCCSLVLLQTQPAMYPFNY